MAKNIYKFTFGCMLVLIACLSFMQTKRPASGRRIAQADNGITRNRVIEPERTIKDVHKDSQPEKVVKLKNARIVIADYDLIRRDFPHIRNLSNPDIDKWILDQVGYISIPQSKQAVVNTPIPVVSEYREAQRPPAYGRALVYEMTDPNDKKTSIGLIDVKGAGGLKPEQADHGNGVATLGECIREYLYENLVRDVLDDADVTNKTVGSYAVIDAGFGVMHSDGSSSPAGLYLRQAQHRVPNLSAWLSPALRERLQTLFHKYGIDPNENIQGTTSDDIFDFGHYVVKNDLPTTIPEKQIPFNVWGYDKSIPAVEGDRWFYSKKDNPWNWSHALAESFHRGEANRHDAWTHFENLLNPARARLTTNRPKDYALDGYRTGHDAANYLKRMIVEKNTFILENIRFNLLNRDHIDDATFKMSFEALIQLTNSLPLLPEDSETERLRLKIIEIALKKNRDTEYPIPVEIEELMLKLTDAQRAKFNLPPLQAVHFNSSLGCIEMVNAIIQ